MLDVLVEREVHLRVAGAFADAAAGVAEVPSRIPSMVKAAGLRICSFGLPAGAAQETPGTRFGRWLSM